MRVVVFLYYMYIQYHKYYLYTAQNHPPDTLSTYCWQYAHHFSASVIIKVWKIRIALRIYIYRIYSNSSRGYY